MRTVMLQSRNKNKHRRHSSCVAVVIDRKSDRSIRPIWHQKEDRVLAYMFVCFIAYVLWKLLGQLCIKAGLGNEPRRVLDELSEIDSMDVVLPTKSGLEIRTRCVSNPSDHQQILLDRLGLNLPTKINLKQMQ